MSPYIEEISLSEVDLLNRYFSTKTLLDVDLNCNEEAKSILQASLSDTSIRHAVTSLKTLREDLETSGDGLESEIQQSPKRSYGFQQYCMALRGLAFDLSSANPSVLKSALLCCQIFISIEQVQKNYTIMAQHIIRGLRIMHEYRARPRLSPSKGLESTCSERLPFLDIFIIKLFAAPCKFPETRSPIDMMGKVSSDCLVQLSPQNLEHDNNRKIAPDMRTKLTRIATSTLEFLDQVSQLQSVESALWLLPAKVTLLGSLDLWLLDVDLFTAGEEVVPISVCLWRMFCSILKVVVLGALDSSPDLDAKLRLEYERLQEIADDATERLKTYSMCTGVRQIRNSTPQDASSDSAPREQSLTI